MSRKSRKSRFRVGDKVYLWPDYERGKIVTLEYAEGYALVRTSSGYSIVSYEWLRCFKVG